MIKPPQTYEGYHRTWHVYGRHKLGEPREEALWFDRRCFHAEEDLLTELASWGTPRIPCVRTVDDNGVLQLQDFIKGRTFTELAPPGTPVSPWYLRQIMARFRQLATVRPEHVTTERRCDPRDHSADGDSAGFLTTLINFTHEQAYQARLPRYGPLFTALGIPGSALARGSWLANEAKALTPRPFCLLHGDLHRANFIVDRWRRLWTIDWELAMIGDPVYDLATHLHLMGYPPGQERDVITRWRRTVAPTLPGADAGLTDDLPRYRAYKCAQSVYTDVVRQAESPSPDTPATIHNVLTRAAPYLDLPDIPSPEHIARAYEQHAATTP